MSVKMYDAQNGGNEIYSESIGTVTLDENGVYSFQFGASGNSTVTKTETIVTTDGSSTNYTGTFTSTPIDGTISVTDETYSWNDIDGNPGEQATAYIIIINGFVIYADIQNGGSGYDDDNPPLVTITGDGTGATGTATVENGVVTGIALPNAGNNYTEGDIIIAPPPAPFTVDKVNGSLEVGYTSSPSNGTELVVTYKTLERTIMGALSEASAHWLELTVDGVAQNPRERIVSVPFAQVALNANSYKVGFKDYLARDNGVVYKESSSGFLFVQPRSGTGVSGEVYLGKSFESLEVVSSYRTASSGDGVPTSSASSSSLIPIPEGYFWRADGYEKISFIPFNNGIQINILGDMSLLNPEESSYNSTFSIVEGDFTWDQARVDAESRGGRLAILDTQDKINSAKAYITDITTNDYIPKVWIGCTDQVSEGQWLWIDGTSVTLNDWGPGQPDNHGGGNQHYASFTDNAVWDDAPLNWVWSNGYLLEMD